MRRNPLTIVEFQAFILFDSDNFDSNNLPNAENIAWWNDKINTFYSTRPHLTNPFNQETPPPPQNDILTKAQQLNIGLEFVDGQWTPAQ